MTGVAKSLSRRTRRPQRSLHPSANYGRPVADAGFVAGRVHSESSHPPQGLKLFVSLSEALDMTTPGDRALAGMLAVFAEFERDILKGPGRTAPGDTGRFVCRLACISADTA